jgi:hypothetical protein
MTLCSGSFGRVAAVDFVPSRLVPEKIRDRLAR